MLRRGDFSRLLQNSPSEIALLGETVVWLGVARLAILIIPFRWMIRALSLQPTLQPTCAAGPAVPQLPGTSTRIAWAVCVVGERTPWQSSCLARALAATVMLRGRGIPSSMTLGVAKSSDGAGLDAHAWLTSGGLIVTGAGGHEKYQVIARYAQSPRRLSD